MKPSLGSIFWFSVSILILSYYNYGKFEKNKQIDKDDIVFGLKVFTISGSHNNKILSATGTWTGDGIAYKNNSSRIICYQKEHVCTLQSVEQIGEKQVSNIDFPTYYDLKKWESDLIIATLQNELGCLNSTITILPKIETAVLSTDYYEYNKENCKTADKKSYKWTLEDSLFWQRMRK
jgi:hypothetical protein